MEQTQLQAVENPFQADMENRRHTTSGRKTRMEGITNQVFHCHFQIYQALINSWQAAGAKASTSANRISVSQTVSFCLSFMKRSAMQSNSRRTSDQKGGYRTNNQKKTASQRKRPGNRRTPNSKSFSGPAIMKTIPSKRRKQAKSSNNDKYFFLRNELASGRSGREQEK